MAENPQARSTDTLVDQHQTTAEPDWLITVEEAAKLLRVSKATIYNMVERKEIPTWRIGRPQRGGIRIPLAELKARIEAEMIGAAKVAA